MGSVPSRYPPPWRTEDALGVPTDADPIDVGVLVVGAGPAGLACAIRMGQLLEEHPELRERLAAPAPPLIPRPHAEHPPVLDEKLRRRRLWKNGDPKGLRLLRQEAAEL